MEVAVTMKQILVAVDEHPHAQQIVDNAIQLASAMSAKILLTYVVPKKSVPAEYRDIHGDALPEHFYQDLFRRAVGPLVKKIEDAGIKYEGILEVGDAAKVITKTAKARNVDFIVIGIHGFRGLSRLRAIGNVARNVIEGATVPILAVP
jgi:nucleotide-binding universal stress UspA family protein